MSFSGRVLFKFLSLLCLLSFGVHGHEDNGLNGDADDHDNAVTSRHIVRKCCAEDEYYNSETNVCTKGGSIVAFESSVKSQLIKKPSNGIVIVTGQLLRCPETKDCYEAARIIDNQSHTLFLNATLYETFFDVTFDLRNYCLERIGPNPQDGFLGIAYCLPEARTLPKCCPPNQYFDSTTFDCFDYPMNSEHEANFLDFVYSRKRLSLRYERLLSCQFNFPDRFSLLGNTYVDECNNVCLGSHHKCYSIRKYCLENVLIKETQMFEPSAYVCADHITKVCCKDEYYEENGIECSCNTNVVADP